MLAIAGGKGGCGKTTTTLGLATDLASRGRRVLAVDADRDMPDLHALAGVSNEPTVAAVGERVPAGTERVSADTEGVSAGTTRGPGSGETGHRGRGECGDPTPGTGVGRRGADRPPAVAEVAHPLPDHPRAAVLPAAPGVTRDQMRRGLRRARRAPGIALVDCPAGAGPAAVDPLRVADRVLLVSTTAPPSLRDATKTAALARAVGTPVAGAVLTRADSVPEGVDRLFGTDVVAVPESPRPVADPAVRRARAEVVDTVC